MTFKKIKVKKMENWNSPLEYIKWKRSKLGRYDLLKDEPILYNDDGDFIYPPMIPVEQMPNHQCQKCRNQTRILLSLIKEEKVEEARKYVDISDYNRMTTKLTNICTPHCTWYLYFEKKRKSAFEKYEKKTEIDYDKEIDKL